MPEELLQPLVDFYQANNQTLPIATRIEPEAMPQPHRQLLVHENDMTPTLEKYHGIELTLRPQRIVRGEDNLQRCVVLKDVDSERVIEFGAIVIQLAGFQWEIQEQIRGCKTPLGTILGQNKITHFCKPSAYFSLIADHAIANALQIEAGVTLYGRRNGLTFPDGKPLADVVEILSPVAKDVVEN